MSIWRPTEALAKRSYDWVLGRWRDYSPAGRAIAAKRAACDQMLDRFARSSGAHFDGTVLVDGLWDNPNYWLRYSMLRAALGLASSREVGIVGQFRQGYSRGTFDRFGFETIESFPDLPVSADIACQVDALVAATKSGEDLLNWTLPAEVPANIVYDGILKRQRLAAVDVNHPLFRAHVREALCAIEQSRVLLDRHNPDLVVLSHPFNFAWGSLAWQALSRGIPVVLLWALFGTLRFTHLQERNLLFRFYDRPSGAEMDALPPDKTEALAGVGRRYLEARFGGRADDLQAIYAFTRANGQIDRRGLCERFGWDATKPIVGFYASNWYDWPHQLGMTEFRDFLDWTRASVEAANRNDSVNWLFKPHPCEDWFGGIALAEILRDVETRPHVAVSDKSWGNANVMRLIDALVTYHGTAGIEFASMGKPVLVPDRGKYDDCGFAKIADTREHYLDLLGTDWWRDIDLATSRRRAEVFSGWWMCAPDWQDAFIMDEDSRQDELYNLIPDTLTDSGEVVDMELGMLRRWWSSRHPFYHTFKMSQASGYQLSNVS